MLYFARMLDKIRQHAESKLREDFKNNLGKALDERCSNFLSVPYTKIVERTLAGGTDETILEWCFENGRRLSETDTLIWNEYARKIGWNDNVTEKLATQKTESGLSHRDDILTMFDFMDADEGR